MTNEDLQKILKKYPKGANILLDIFGTRTCLCGQYLTLSNQHITYSLKGNSIIINEEHVKRYDMV